MRVLESYGLQLQRTVRIVEWPMYPWTSSARGTTLVTDSCPWSRKFRKASPVSSQAPSIWHCCACQPTRAKPSLAQENLGWIGYEFLRLLTDSIRVASTRRSLYSMTYLTVSTHLKLNHVCHAGTAGLLLRCQKYSRLAYPRRKARARLHQRSSPHLLQQYRSSWRPTVPMLYKSGGVVGRWALSAGEQAGVWVDRIAQL
jgi:hypothetical protein